MADYGGMKTEAFDRIIKMASVFSEEEVSEALSVSRSTVYRVISIDRFAKAGDVEAILQRNYSKEMRAWVAAKYGIDLTPAPKAPAPVAVEKQVADDKNIAELIAAVSRINGNLITLTQHVDAVGTLLKDVINANADILYNEVASHKDILNGIKANCRRRGE